MICSDCKFVKVIPVQDDYDSSEYHDFFRCHRFPPVYVISNFGHYGFSQWEFPKVEADYYCGEWQYE